MTIKFWLSGFACFLLTACGTPAEDNISDNERAAVPVSAIPAELATLGEQLSLTGTLTAERQTRLSPRADGLVAHVHVEAGDHVETGQRLLELDPALAQQALMRARAQEEEANASVREAERLVNEAQRLAERQAIPATEVASRVAALNLARASAASAQAATREQEELVERHSLPAPFPGVVAEKLTEVGEWVQRGTPVLSLVTIDRIRLDVQVPQERFGQLDEQAQAQVYADTLDDTPLPAQIIARVPVTDPEARTFLLRLLVNDPQGRLLPGTSARAEISLPPQATDTLAISRDALLRQPDGSHSVYIVDNTDDERIARRRQVQILYEQGGQVAVAGDTLRQGDPVVTRGNEALTDGQSVEVVER